MTATGTTQHEYSRYRALYGLLVISLGSMMGPLDAAVNVAFPVITEFFSLRIADIQWIVIVYVLAQSCVTIVFGNLGDLYGHKRIFLIGTIACAIIHLLAGFAPNYPALVGLRVLQGLSVGIALSCGPAIVTFLYPPEQKRYALGLFTMLFGFGLAVGPVVGGWLLELFGWPSVFWYRTPIAFTAFVLAIFLPLPHVMPEHKPRFDALGALYLVLVLGSFVALLSMTRRAGSVWIPFAMLALWLATVWLFARQELRTTRPVIDVRHYRNPIFAGIQFTTIAVNFFIFVIFLLIPYMLGARGDLSLLWSGIILAVYPCGTVTGGYLGGRLSGRVSSLAMVRIGMVVMAAGLIAIGLTGALPSIVPTALFLFMTGLGLGTFQVGNLDLTTSILSAGERGVAGSLVNVGRLLGIVSGAAGITWLYDGLDRYGDRMLAFRDTFVILGIAFLAFALVVNLTVFRNLPQKADPAP